MSEETKTLRELLSDCSSAVGIVIDRQARRDVAHGRLMLALVAAIESEAVVRDRADSMLAARVEAMEPRKYGLVCRACGKPILAGEAYYFDVRGVVCRGCNRCGNESDPPAVNPAPAQATAGNEEETKRCAECKHLIASGMPSHGVIGQCVGVLGMAPYRFTYDVCGCRKYVRKEAGDGK